MDPQPPKEDGDLPSAFSDPDPFVDSAKPSHDASVDGAARKNENATRPQSSNNTTSAVNLNGAYLGDGVSEIRVHSSDASDLTKQEQSDDKVAGCAASKNSGVKSTSSRYSSSLAENKHESNTLTPQGSSAQELFVRKNASVETSSVSATDTSKQQPSKETLPAQTSAKPSNQADNHTPQSVGIKHQPGSPSAEDAAPTENVGSSVETSKAGFISPSTIGAEAPANVLAPVSVGDVQSMTAGEAPSTSLNLSGEASTRNRILIEKKATSHTKPSPSDGKPKVTQDLPNLPSLATLPGTGRSPSKKMTGNRAPIPMGVYKVAPSNNARKESTTERTLQDGRQHFTGYSPQLLLRPSSPVDAVDVETEASLQPIARDAPDYYLHDDEVLVEENQLPPRPSGRYAPPAKSSALQYTPDWKVISVPPRTLGTVQDQINATKLMCCCKSTSKMSHTNKGSGCLILYCDCFASGNYCNEDCDCFASCSNNSAERNVKPRTEAIVDVLKQDSHAFRYYSSTIAEQQKQHRFREAKGEVRARKLRRLNSKQTDKSGTKTASPTSDHGSSTKKAPEMPSQAAKKIGNDGGLEYIPPEDVLATKLQPSYYTVPLKVNDGSTVLTGLSVSLTHPRNRKRKAKPTDARKKLYHSLELSPTRIGEKNPEKGDDTDIINDQESSIYAVKKNVGGSGNATAAVPVDKLHNMRAEKAEARENLKDGVVKMDEFFEAMRTELTASSTKAVSVPLFQTDLKTANAAVTALASVQDDMQNIKRVVDAAKLDIMSRKYRESRLKEYLSSDLTEDDGRGIRYNAMDVNELEELKCKEELAPRKKDRETVEESKLKDLTILAAKDTALLQEVARVIRRKARELAERRIQKES